MWPVVRLSRSGAAREFDRRPGLLDWVRGVSPKRRSHVGDNFDREVDEWFEQLEGQLAPAGRITPVDADDEGPTAAARPVLSNPSTLGPPRGSIPGLRRTVQVESTPDPESTPKPESAQQVPNLAHREMQLVRQKRELVRTEALVDVMKELASEIRSVRRDVDQIKAIIAKLRRLAEAKRRGGASPATRRRAQPRG